MSRKYYKYYAKQLLAMCIHILCVYMTLYTCMCVNVIILFSFVHISGYAVAQWLGIRLQMLGVAMVTGVSFIAVLEHHFNTVDPGTVHDCNNVYCATQN